MAKPTAYDKVTSAIIEALEKGTIPWRRPWSGGGAPINAVSKRAYRGVNNIVLELTQFGKGYESAVWCTFKQAKDIGGRVRKGEKGSPIVFWKMLESKDKEGNARTIPFLRSSTVFNVDQIDWEDDKRPSDPEVKTWENEPVARCESVIAGYAGPEKTFGGDRCCYMPALDRVNMVRIDRFESVDEYYSTFFHELIHSTGHKDRLARPGIETVAAFGDPVYSKEELVAEMGATFLAHHVGVDSTLQHSASYIASWIRVLKGDPKLAVHAAGAAQRAADLVLGVNQ